MEAKLIIYLGIILLLIGLFFIINAFYTITGFIILEKAGKIRISTIGSILAISGIILIVLFRDFVPYWGKLKYTNRNFGPQSNQNTEESAIAILTDAYKRNS